MQHTFGHGPAGACGLCGEGVVDVEGAGAEGDSGALEDGLGQLHLEDVAPGVADHLAGDHLVQLVAGVLDARHGVGDGAVVLALGHLVLVVRLTALVRACMQITKYDNENNE